METDLAGFEQRVEGDWPMNRAAGRVNGGTIFALLCFLATSHPLRAIVVSDEPNDHIVTPPSDYDMVGNMIYMGQPGGSTAVLIDPWHILTAGHVVNAGMASDHTFKLHLPDGVRTYNVVARHLHPAADIAVCRLDRSTKLPGYPLYTNAQELGQTGILVGYGVSGTGTTGPDSVRYPRGTKRFGYNRIDEFYVYNPDIFRMDFDGPTGYGPLGGRTLGASKEVMMAPGDSGGPTLLSVNGTLCIAGIHTTLFDDGDGKCPDYGDIGGDLRVSSYASWIVSQVPPTVSLSVSINNPQRGHVTISPEPTDPNQPQFPAGTEVTLTAVAEPNESFSCWQIHDPNHPGDANFVVSDANNPLKIVLNQDREIVAVFKCGAVGSATILAMSAAGGLVVIRRFR